jgi:hypothetical protein
MKYRIAEFCELPEKLDYAQQIVFRLGNPEFFNDQLFKDPGMLSPADQRTGMMGITKAAKVLDCDFAVVNPPQYYRVLLELALTQEGIVPVYPELDVAKGGHIHLMRFKVGEHLPNETLTHRLEEVYEQWKKLHFAELTEVQLAICQDPWRMFLDREARTLFQRSMH